MKRIALQKNFFDNKAKIWSINSNQNDKEQLTEIFHHRIPKLVSPILDAGSGTGVLLKKLYQKSQKPISIIELDLSLQMLLENRNIFSVKYPALYLQTNVENMPIKEQSIGTVICFASFAHFNNRRCVLQNFYRILKSGGRLIILHLMCHHRLNHLHHQAGFPVRNDRLPPLNVLCNLVCSVGFEICDSEENKNTYLINASKRSSDI